MKLFIIIIIWQCVWSLDTSIVDSNVVMKKAFVMIFIVYWREASGILTKDGSK